MSTGPNPEIGQRIVAAGAVADDYGQGSDCLALAQRIMERCTDFSRLGDLLANDLAS